MVGLLATVDERGAPHVRWLVPTILHDRPGALYALSLSKSGAVAQARSNPSVEWLIQTPTLDEIITLRGRMNVVDTPSLRMEVLDTIGPRLWNFWKLADGREDMVVLETVIETAVHYLPMEGRTSSACYAAAES